MTQSRGKKLGLNNPPTNPWESQVLKGRRKRFSSHCYHTEPRISSPVNPSVEVHSIPLHRHLLTAVDEEKPDIADNGHPLNLDGRKEAGHGWVGPP